MIFYDFSVGIDIKKIKLLREALGMTQQEAATKSGLKSRQHWNNVEAGQRTNLTIDSLEKIAKALGVKAFELMK